MPSLEIWLDNNVHTFSCFSCFSLLSWIEIVMSVRSAVFESLHYSLSANKQERESGEEKLKALEVTEGDTIITSVIA